MRARFDNERTAHSFIAAVKDDGGTVQRIRKHIRRSGRPYGHPLEIIWTVTFTPREDDDTDQCTVG